jgi:hypothetical protein
MPAIRITINTDDIADDDSCNWEAARKAVSSGLTELARLLKDGKYVGRFRLGAPWKVECTAPLEHDAHRSCPTAATFLTQDAAIQWVNEHWPHWQHGEFEFVPTGIELSGDVDEL